MNLPKIKDEFYSHLTSSRVPLAFPEGPAGRSRKRNGDLLLAWNFFGAKVRNARKGVADGSRISPAASGLRVYWQRLWYGDVAIL
jgi:hypothetical protein